MGGGLLEIRGVFRDEGLDQVFEGVALGVVCHRLIQLFEPLLQVGMGGGWAAEADDAGVVGGGKGLAGVLQFLKHFFAGAQADVFDFNVNVGLEADRHG